MNLFFYSSPYKYYAENIIPVAKHARKMGHNVYGAYSFDKSTSIKGTNEIPILPNNSGCDQLRLFLNGSLNIDAVIITQPWWYMEFKIVSYCKKHRIPFYIIDHAPIMTEYVERNGKESHLYRASLRGCRAFFSYGQNTIDIMKKKGCEENMVSMGSPRFEGMMKSIKKHKRKVDGESKIAVIYDTSARMEDEAVVKSMVRLRKALGASDNWQFLLKEHPRSPKVFRQLCDSYENFNIYRGKSNEELIAMSSLDIFSFPSSSMILSAMAGNGMAGLYGNHFSTHARSYSNRYSNIIFDYVNNKLSRNIEVSKKYKPFLKENIKLLEIPSKIRILNYIEKDLR
jgi:hypothetical protein|tara:strand:- start:41703 stop:42728 length:1026 start_codon:yes stop_codon:yes gene_type:complete